MNVGSHFSMRKRPENSSLSNLQNSFRFLRPMSLLEALLLLAVLPWSIHARELPVLFLERVLPGVGFGAPLFRICFSKHRCSGYRFPRSEFPRYLFLNVHLSFVRGQPARVAYLTSSGYGLMSSSAFTRQKRGPRKAV